jgi:hypothetical protein
MVSTDLEDTIGGRHLQDQVPIMATTIKLYRAGLPKMALKGMLTSAMLNRTLSVWKFSSISNVTRREIQPRGITRTRPTPENGCDGWSFDIGICSFLKAAKLIRFSAAPPSIRIRYNLMLMMVREMSSGSCLAPLMLLGQSEPSKLVDVSIHLWCGAAFWVGAATTSRRKFLMMRWEVMSQEPPNMT